MTLSDLEKRDAMGQIFQEDILNIARTVWPIERPNLVRYNNFVPKTWRFQIFYFKNCRNLETRVRVTQSHRNWHGSVCYTRVLYPNGWRSLQTFYRPCSSIDNTSVTLQSNHESVSYRFQDKRRFHSKIANFPHPMYLTPPLQGPLELGTDARVKNENDGATKWSKSFKIGLAV